MHVQNKISCINNLIWVGIFLLAAASHICLDYEYTDPHQHMVRVPMGQYFAFFFIIFGSYLSIINNSSKMTFSPCYPTKVIFFSSFLFLGFAIASSSGFWNFRLLAIITIMSISACLIGLFSHSYSRQLTALQLLTFPYLIPIFGAFFLEISGEISFGVVWRNPKHIEYPFPRWYFLNSYANGFGLDAAISSFSSLFLVIFQNKNAEKIIWTVIFCLSGIALLLSGTRAAWLLLLVLMLAYLFFVKRTKRGVLYASLGVSVLFLSIYFLNSISVNFLRLSADLNSFSSNRFQGALHLIEAIGNRHFLGYGFGEAKDLGAGIPSNLFYLGLAYEIGIMGAVLTVFTLASPFLLLLLRMKIISNSQTSILEKPLDIWCFCVGIGLIFYQLFEFDLLRVSATNILFFFCFGRVIAILWRQSKQAYVSQ